MFRIIVASVKIQNFTSFIFYRPERFLMKNCIKFQFTKNLCKELSQYLSQVDHRNSLNFQENEAAAKSRACWLAHQFCTTHESCLINVPELLFDQTGNFSETLNFIFNTYGHFCIFNFLRFPDICHRIDGSFRGYSPSSRKRPL